MINRRNRICLDFWNKQQKTRTVSNSDKYLCALRWNWLEAGISSYWAMAKSWNDNNAVWPVYYRISNEYFEAATTLKVMVPN